MLGFLLLCAIPEALAGSVVRDECDGLEGRSQLVCIEEKYPKIFSTVEQGCAAAAEASGLRQCRIDAYATRGIRFVGSGRKATAVSVAGAEDAKKVSAVGGATTTSAASDTSRARAGTSGETARRSEGAASASSAKSSTAKIDQNALTAATLVLTLAGVTMQQVPSLCKSDPKCKMSKDEQATVAAFGVVVSAAGARIPTILAGGGSDEQKAGAVLAALGDLQAAAPTGLRPEAQAAVSAGHTAAGSIAASLGR